MLGTGALARSLARSQRGRDTTIWRLGRCPWCSPTRSRTETQLLRAAAQVPRVGAASNPRLPFSLASAASSTARRLAASTPPFWHAAHTPARGCGSRQLVPCDLQRAHLKCPATPLSARACAPAASAAPQQHWGTAPKELQLQLSSSCAYTPGRDAARHEPKLRVPRTAVDLHTQPRVQSRSGNWRRPSGPV